MTSEATIKQPPLKDLIASLILKTHIPERHAARNALAHIEKAWIIRDIDPAMSVFRAITGVEEATTAIFHALKRKKYDNAKCLNKKRHFHKAAMHPFLSAIATVFDSIDIKVQLHFDSKEKNPKLKVAILSTFDDGFLYPDPPLHYLVSKNGLIYDFSHEIENIITTQNAESFLQYSHDLAQERNNILYAKHNGIPAIIESLTSISTARNLLLSHCLLYSCLLPNIMKNNCLFSRRWTHMLKSSNLPIRKNTHSKLLKQTGHKCGVIFIPASMPCWLAWSLCLRNNHYEYSV